jgi:hypothetical protein
MGTAGVAERTNNLGLYSWEDGADLYNHIQLNYNWVTIDSDVLKKTWAGTNDYAYKIFLSGTEGTSGTVLSTRISADTEGRFNVLGGGTVTWSSGGTSTDTNLYRGGTSTLSTDSTLRITSGSVEFLNGTVSLTATDTPTTKLSTDAWIGITKPSLGTAFTITNSSAGVEPTLAITAEGLIGWGSGTSSQDASIYRSGAGTLTFDADLVVNGKISFGSASVTGWNVSNVTTTRTYNSEQVSINEVADTLGTLVNDLKTIGILGA